MGHRIFGTAVAAVYPHYLAKVQRKGGRTQAELDEAICWLTGFDECATSAVSTSSSTSWPAASR